MMHEPGHFVTAKRFGMRADRFFLGFGPTLWSTRRGETEYGVKALPLGGFVRIKGMCDLDERLPPGRRRGVRPDALAADHDRDRDRARRGRAGAARRRCPTRPGRGSRPICSSAARRREFTERIVHRTRHERRPDAGRPAARHAPCSTRSSPARCRHRPRRRPAPPHHAGRPRALLRRPAGLAARHRAGRRVGRALRASRSPCCSACSCSCRRSWSGSTTVVSDGPARHAGRGGRPASSGDRVLAVEGTRQRGLRRAARRHPGRAGQPTELIVDRGGEEVTLTLTPERGRGPRDGRDGRPGRLRADPDRRPAAGRRRGPRPRSPARSGSSRSSWATFGGHRQRLRPEGLGSLFSQATGAEERDSRGRCRWSVPPSSPGRPRRSASARSCC